MHQRTLRTSQVVPLVFAAACGRIGYEPHEGGLDVARDTAHPRFDAHEDTSFDASLDADDVITMDHRDVMMDVDLDGRDALTTHDATTGCDDATCACCAAICTEGAFPTPSVCAGGVDTSRYAFEGSTDGWVLATASNVEIPGGATSTTEGAFAGTGSLQATASIPAAGVVYIRLESPVGLVPGDTVTFHVWVPTDATFQSLQAYLLDATFMWTGNYYGLDLGQLVAGCWNTLTVHVPTTFVAPAAEIGVQVGTVTAWSGMVRVDAVSW